MANLILASVLIASIIGFHKTSDDFNTLAKQTNNKASYSQTVKPNNESKRERLLAQTIFGECRGCSYKGKLAVGYTVLNRVKAASNTTKETIERVILKPHQYSCWGKNNKNKREMMNVDHLDPKLADYKGWQESKEVAHQLLNNKPPKDPTNGAIFYHATSVKPNWRNMIKLCQIGQHFFYKPRVQVS